MKMTVLALLLSPSAFGADLCSRYNDRPEYLSALSALSVIIEKDMNVICSSDRILDIEIQPSQVINSQGEIVPQMAVFFHYEDSSCKYLLDRQALTLTTARCYPTW